MLFWSTRPNFNICAAGRALRITPPKEKRSIPVRFIGSTLYMNITPRME